MNLRHFLLIGFIASLAGSLRADVTVGSVVDGGTFVATGQTVRPAGETVAFAGRPVDLVLSPEGTTVYVKNDKALLVLDAATWQIRQKLDLTKDGCSMHGIAVTRDGTRVYVTSTGKTMWEAQVGADGKLTWGRKINLGKDTSYPCGLALSRDGKRAYVALSYVNSLAIVDLEAGKTETEIPVGVAPFDVVLGPDEATAYVSNWGGPRPQAGERAAASAGTDTLVDERGIPCSGTVAKIDLVQRTVVAEVAVGLHPSDLELRPDGTRLYVANANSDTVSIIDTKAFQVVETVLVRPDEKLPFGSITCGLALSPDGKTLLAANGGNNAVAVIALGEKSVVRGFIPAGWFPSAVAADGQHIYITNAKGEGSRQGDPGTTKWHVKWPRGTASKVPVPSAFMLGTQTVQVRATALVPQALRAFERVRRGARPVPVPKQVGDPSVFEHVVYVLKENRTYDQVLGDLGRGNSDPQLCIYGRAVTPNHHALAEQFVLLDNYYCNGVVSADGHQWATQGITTDYQEKTFGGWTRSYDFGTDPLAFAPTDFIWDHVLLHGLSFRNYGEFVFSYPEPAGAKWGEIYANFKTAGTNVTFRHYQKLNPLERYTCMDYPGWQMRIPDAMRIEVFLKEFAEYEKNGNWPNLVFVYLPQDHTSGKSSTAPTPRAHVADNDLALGRLVEAISKSRFWAKTCIFVNEDDPQDGFDHVDGHRSLCLVISPYTKREKVVSRFYNQTSVLHTIERILGLPPMNQLDALAPTMEDCFTTKPDFTPYTALPNNIPIDEMNQPAAALQGAELLAQQNSEAMDLSEPDRINDDLLNRILWLDAKGQAVLYPAHLAGAHGRGLKALRLKLDLKAQDDDD